MDTVVCVGGGAIGSQAARDARRNGDRVLVIDRDERCPSAGLADRRASEADEVLAARPGEVLFLLRDGVAALGDLMLRWTPDLVVPATPGHLAARLAVERARARGRELVPCPDALDDVELALPPGTVQLADREHAVIVTSYMPPGGTCIDRCPRPLVCPVTSHPLPGPMHAAVGTALAASSFRTVVLTTSGTGVGGMAGKDLRALLRAVDQLKESETLGVATACSCHGVANLLRLR